MIGIGLAIRIQTLPLPSLRNIAGLGLSDVRITLAGTIISKPLDDDANKSTCIAARNRLAVYNVNRDLRRGILSRCMGYSDNRW